MNRPRAGLLSTVEGRSSAAFTRTDWGLLLGVTLTWGASFLFMSIGLDAFAPGVVTLGRVAFGALTLALLPGGRTPIDREDMPRIVLLATSWIAVPLTLFPIAQQWIDSSVAGMLNASMPALTALLASVLLHRLPGTLQRVGITIGFLGVACISAPTIGGADAAWLGVVLVILATAGYAIAANVVTPLQHKYGSLPVLAQVQAVAAMMVVPYGLYGLPDSTFEWPSFLAVATLGIAGTGLAYSAFGSLIGNVGATRASIVTYLIPAVAIVLGVAVRGESVAALALLGCALVLVGAWLSSRQGR
ncbi:MAG: DMT family transporter [Actinomycetia bacterium]|nr:DMT family transporter [Actinomycetes bacterium]MCP4960634.1 DMT family transporter [Actinomycetes bacterium]